MHRQECLCHLSQSVVCAGRCIDAQRGMAVPPEAGFCQRAIAEAVCVTWEDAPMYREEWLCHLHQQNACAT